MSGVSGVKTSLICTLLRVSRMSDVKLVLLRIIYSYPEQSMDLQSEIIAVKRFH